MVRKYLNYIIFGAVVLLVVGLAVRHSRYMRSLVDAMASSDSKARSDAAAELIKGEQFMDSITGEPIETRIKAAEALEILGTPEAVKQAVSFLKDSDKPVRDRLIVTLQHIGAKSPDHTKELVVGLKEGDSNVRKGTIAALSSQKGGVGPKPGVVAAIAAIMKAEAGARGPGGDVLGSALFTKGGGNAESVPALFTLLKDKDEGVRVGAGDALGKVGDPAAVDTLKEAMHNDTAQVRRVAIGSLALIASPKGEDSLTEAINNPDDDNESRAQAAMGLGKIGTPTAIATLIKSLDDDDLKLRSATVASLSRAGRPVSNGPANTLVLNALKTALGDTKETLRQGAAQALQTIAASETNAALVAILQKDSPTVQASAALALGFPGNKEAVAPLIKALSDPAEVVNAAARDALTAIGPEATDALMVVMQQGGANAYYAAQAVAHMGVTALPSLQRAAQNVNPVSQRWAAVALGDLGVAEARPLLQQLEKSADPDVAYVAKEQLDKLGRTQ